MLTSDQSDQSDKSDKSDQSDKKLFLKESLNHFKGAIMNDSDGVLLPHGGYERLRSYQVAEAVYDATV